LLRRESGRGLFRERYPLRKFHLEEALLFALTNGIAAAGG